MNLFLNTTSGVPLYEQLSTQIKNRIISGVLKKDEPLPSIRALASDLHISVITVKRTYEDLVRAGFLYAVPAKGYFVAEISHADIERGVYTDVNRHLYAACTEAAKITIPAAELHRLLDENYARTQCSGITEEV